jgi:membrane-bound lytic murein transglycosylase D
LYRVRRGDSVTEIARRFGVGLEDLLAVNRIRDRNRISVGQVLQIPGGANTARTSPSGETTPGVYTVRRGDTLYKIARRFGVTQGAIVALNGLRDRNQIRRGQMLYIPGSDAQETRVAKAPAVKKETPAPVVAEAVPAPTATVADAPASKPAPPVELPLDSKGYAVRSDGSIEVQPSETLGHFADWLEIPTSALRRRNGLAFGSALPIGRRLHLDFSQVSAERFQERRLAHHRTLRSAFYLAYEVAGTEEYVLKRGDSLWTLSRGDRSIPVWLLLEYNPELDFGSLRAGQRLTLPKIAKRRG